MIEYVGNIENFWSKDLKEFKFPVMSPLDNSQRSYWTHPNYNNVPPLKQAFDEDLPIYWENFLRKLNLEKGTVSWTCIEPGQVIPVHADKFFKLRNKYGTDIDNCLRYLIFLEDWVLGHSVDFDEKTITRWHKGDVYVFDHKSFHCAANASQVDFITCQVNTIKD